MFVGRSAEAWSRSYPSATIETMDHNPTRREGKRTGAIPVDEAQVSRIVNKIFRSPRAKRDRNGDITLTTKTSYITLKRGKGKKVRFRRTSREIDVKDKVASYATGIKEPLLVRVVDRRSWDAHNHEGAGGWASTHEMLPGKKVPQKKRVERISRALEALGVRPTETLVNRALAAGVASHEHDRRVAAVHLVTDFDEPYPERWLRTRLSNVLRHELAHSADEQVRRRQMSHVYGSTPFDVLNDDVVHVVRALGLPRKKLLEWDRTVRDPRRTSSRPVRRSNVEDKFGADYYNDPVEVTARLPEIFEEISKKRPRVAADVSELMKMGQARGQALETAFMWSSPTLSTIAFHWTPKTQRRVMTAMYDRFHEEPWWPRATGVLKNRRTSRRRTSRRSYATI